MNATAFLSFKSERSFKIRGYSLFVSSFDASTTNERRVDLIGCKVLDSLTVAMLS